MDIGIGNVVLIIVGLLLAIFVHEGGHFSIAKIAGIKVFEFAVGLGPKVFKKVKNNTTYSFRLLPLGGYVLIASRMVVKELKKTGEAQYQNIHKSQLLDEQKWWVKIIFFLAGITFNFLFAVFLALFIDYLVYKRWVFDYLANQAGKGIWKLFEELFTGNIFIKTKSQISSIVGSTVHAAETTDQIRWFYFYFLNLSLIMFNLLPIPPLDGYRVLEILFCKFIYKKELKEKTSIKINIVGIIIIVALFLLVLIADIIKIE